MRKKRIIILLLQIVIVAATAFLFINYTNQEVSPMEVYVYNADIEDVSYRIEDSDIRKITIPARAMNKDFATNKEDIVGKHVDSKVKAGQHIYLSQLIEGREVDVFETIDLSRYRKVSLPISFVEGMAGNIKRGDVVDLIYSGTGSYEEMDENGRLMANEFIYSKVFLQDILVYSVNTADGFKFQDRSEQAGFTEEQLTTEASTDEMEIITLAVTLEQAEEISTRKNSGEIGFIGRFEESDSYDTLGYVLGDYQKIFSGKGYAETSIISVEDESFTE